MLSSLCQLPGAALARHCGVFYKYNFHTAEKGKNPQASLPLLCRYVHAMFAYYCTFTAVPLADTMSMPFSLPMTS